MSQTSSPIQIILPDDIQFKIFQSIHSPNKDISTNYIKYYNNNGNEFLMIHIEKMYKIEEYEHLLFMNILCNNLRNNIMISTNIFNVLYFYLYDDDTENNEYKHLCQNILKEFLNIIYTFFTDNYIPQSLYIKIFEQLVKESQENEINFNTSGKSLSKKNTYKSDTSIHKINFSLDETFKDKLYTFFKIKEKEIDESKRTITPYYYIYDDAQYKKMYILASEKHNSLYINLSYVFSEGMMTKPKYFILSNIHKSDSEDDVRKVVKKIGHNLLTKTNQHYVSTIINHLCKKFNITLKKS